MEGNLRVRASEGEKKVCVDQTRFEVPYYSISIHGVWRERVKPRGGELTLVRKRNYWWNVESIQKREASCNLFLWSSSPELPPNLDNLFKRVTG